MRTIAFVLAALVLQTASAAGSRPVANGSVSSRRAVTATTLDARTIGHLRIGWSFRFPRSATAFGAITANPIIARGTVYVQDSSSSVYALSAADGALRWKHTFSAPNDGPNGLAVVGGRVYTATDTTALALDAATGKLLWQRRLATRYEQFVAIAPVVDRGRVYYSTQGFPPGGRGALYALASKTGKLVWRFQTVARPWPNARAGGGGVWYPVSVDERGDVYAGTANPAPWGGSRAFPNGALFAGSTLFTDSLVVLAGRPAGCSGTTR